MDVVSWICDSGNAGLTAFILPTVLFLLSEFIGWLPQNRVSSSSVTELLVNAAKAVLKSQPAPIDIGSEATEPPKSHDSKQVTDV